MSEHITHIAVFDDAARLALEAETLAPPLAAALKKHWNAGRLGACTRSGDAFSVGLLKKWRDQWPGKPKDRLDEKLAFLLGWRCHQAGDRRFKTVYRELQPEHYAARKAKGPEDDDAPSDTTVYQDMVVFREVYGNGSEDPFFPETLEFETDARLENLFRSVWHRTLLEQQRFLKDDGDADAWLKLLFERMEPFNVDVRRYAAAYRNPDPAFLYRFIEAPNFYNPDDPIIAIARAIQHRKPPPGVKVQDAVAGWRHQSQYAQSVAMGYDMLLATTEYFEKRIGEDDLKKRYLIGVSHLETKWN